MAQKSRIRRENPLVQAHRVNFMVGNFIAEIHFFCRTHYSNVTGIFLEVTKSFDTCKTKHCISHFVHCFNITLPIGNFSSYEDKIVETSCEIFTKYVREKSEFLRRPSSIVWDRTNSSTPPTLPYVRKSYFSNFFIF